MPPVHAAWLPDSAFAHLAGRRATVLGEGPCVTSVRTELTRAGAVLVGESEAADLLLAAPAATADGLPSHPEGYLLSRSDGTTTVLATAPEGLLHGFFHVVRLGAARDVLPRLEGLRCAVGRHQGPGSRRRARHPRRN